MTDLPIPPTKRTTPRKPTPKEMSLTKADIAFKEAIIEDVEFRVREIMPALVRAIIAEDLSGWIDEVVEQVNIIDVAVGSQNTAIAGLVRAVFPDLEPTEQPTQGATNDGGLEPVSEPDDTTTNPDTDAGQED